MVFYCLTPIEVADECSLLQAVDWVALRRLPRDGQSDIGSFSPATDDDDLKNYDLYCPTDIECCNIYYPMCECGKAGSPILEHDFDMKIQDRIENAEECQLMVSFTDDEEEKEVLEECALWMRNLKKEREPGMSLLYLALREGKIQAYGIKLLKRDFEENNRELKKQNKSMDKMDFTLIPASSWSYEPIDWRQSRAHLSDGYYVRIYINVEQLLTVFPPPEKQSSITFDKVAGYYVINDKEQTEADIETKQIRPSNAGRSPKHDWDKIQSYIDQKLWERNIPQKQDAFVAEIRDWCATNAMSVPSRSSLKERLSRIYQVCRAKE